MSTHMLNGVIFMVQPSDSWEQPDAYGTPEEEVNHQGPSPILALNDDCLEHIMAKLGLQDRLRFARSCLRFRASFQASASLHTSLDLSQFRGLTVWDIRDFFQLFGAHIQTMTGVFKTDHSERLAEFIRDYCSSLRSMQVICNPQLGLHLHTMIANKSQLEELQLSNSDIDDEALFDLQDLINLRKLNLSRGTLTGYTLDKLPISVEELVLDECPYLSDTYLTDMCLRLPKLRKLSIRNVLKSSFRIFETMEKESSCPSLEVLRITIA
ncbi:uncharacterized protein LOC128256663 [Drosophila gunungcola]|nr:uncharacterized protein LOC128256663 [Drosophila gunungcola]